MATYETTLTPIPGVENLTYADANILLSFQRIWLENLQGSREFTHSSLRNLPDQTAIETQIFEKLPAELYNEFRKYYNQDDAQEFLDFYSKYFINNWQTVIAYKNNDKAAIDFSIEQWNQTADELASFLAGLSDYLDEDQWRVLFRDYVNLKNMEINAFIKGNYDLEAEIYLQLVDLVTQIANNMAMSIIFMRHNQENK